MDTNPPIPSTDSSPTQALPLLILNLPTPELQDRMTFTSSVVRIQTLVEQKKAPSFSHQISLSIGSCVLSNSVQGDPIPPKCSPSKAGAWFDHIWNATTRASESASRYVESEGSVKIMGGMCRPTYLMVRRTDRDLYRGGGEDSIEEFGMSFTPSLSLLFL